MNNKLLNPKKYSDSLSGVTPISLSGQTFINEATDYIKLNPFTHTVAQNMVNRAMQTPDSSVQNWAKSQQSFIDENFMTFNIGLICESARYTSEVFNGFKSVAGELLEMGEAEIIRAIAVDGAFSNYQMFPEVKFLVQKAKNLALAQSGVNNIMKPEDKANLKPVLSLCQQINAYNYVIGFDGNVTLILDQSTNGVTLGKYSDIVALVDTENFALDYEGFVTSLRALKTLENYYDSDMQSFVFSVQGNQILWRLTDNYIFLNGEDSTFEKINQVILAKVTANTTTSIDSSSEELYTAFNILWVVRDALMLSDIVACIPNNEGVVFALVYDNKSLSATRPYTYTSISKYRSSDSVYMSVTDNYNDFSKQFTNSYAHSTIRKLYQEQIKAEEAFMFAIMSNNQSATENIASLTEEREKLEIAKANLPTSSLDEVNAKIMSIDDLIAKQKNSIVSI